MGSLRSDSVGSVSSSRDASSQAGERRARLTQLEPPPERVLGRFVIVTATCRTRCSNR